MAFEDDVDKVGDEIGSSSDFYKVQEGDNRLHILTEPKIEVSRWGYGTCYEGAPYCTDKQIEEDYQEALKKNPEAIKATLSKKWMCWAIERKTNKLVILTLTWAIAKQLTALKRSEESGFENWPMPYGINIVATDGGKKFNGKTVFDYNIIASRKDTDITKDELTALAKCTSIEAIIEKKKEKARGGVKVPTRSIPTETHYPEEDLGGEVPF